MGRGVGNILLEMEGGEGGDKMRYCGRADQEGDHDWTVKNKNRLKITKKRGERALTDVFFPIKPWSGQRAKEVFSYTCRQEPTKTVIRDAYPTTGEKCSNPKPNRAELGNLMEGGDEGL